MAFTPDTIHIKLSSNVQTAGPGLKTLARTAWKSAPQEPSRRVRYDPAQLIPEVFFVERCGMFLKLPVSVLSWQLGTSDLCPVGTTRS
jgi:hypothetical protein